VFDVVGRRRGERDPEATAAENLSHANSATQEPATRGNGDVFETLPRYPRRVSQERAQFGLLGERVAQRWLERAGWRVLQRRFRSGHRDIDLIAERNGLVAFVEVKARRAEERGAGFGDPVEAVNWRKQRELSRSASVWIDRHGRPGEVYRFDVIGVLVVGDRVRVRHVANAFQLVAKSH